MRERRAGLSWITLVILLLTYATIGSVDIRTASGKALPVIYVDPAINTAAPDKTFAVNINVAGITGEESLYGWEFTLSFNPSVLEVATHNETHQIPGTEPPIYYNVTVYHVYEDLFLKDLNTTLFYAEPNEQIYTAGIVKALCAFKIPFPPQGAIGSGVLATIEFRVKAQGATLLHFADTELDTVIGETTSPIPHRASDGFFEYPLKVHDIAVTNVTPSPASVLLGENVSINVTVKNEGTATETFTVTALYDPTEIETKTVTALAQGKSKTLNFTWNTAGVTPGTFIIKVEVPPVPGETDTSDNTATTDVTVLFHDIAITSVMTSHIQVKVGDSATINVTVANEGDFPETLDVTAYYFNETLSDVIIGTPQVLDLDPRDSQVVAFTWDTTNVSLGRYTIKANATIPTGDTNTTNNELIDGTVTVATFNIVDHSIKVGKVTFHVIIESNSTLSNFEFIRADKKISFNVTGSEGTVGYCNVTIPKVLLGGPFTVSVDSFNATPIDQPSNGTHTFLYFTYSHSTQTVHIIGTTIATLPLASFEISPAPPYYVGDTLTFNASASEDPDGKIVSYAWDFDDGKYGTSNVTTHTYQSPQEYTVSLTVTDNDGLFDTTTKTVTIAKMSSAISITAYPKYITLEKSTTIGGSITPTRTKVTVTIQSRPAGGTWTTLRTLATDGSQYSYVWTPTTMGTYELKASWSGDAKTESAESGVITIEVVGIKDIPLEVGGVSFHVVIESNSTVSNFQLISEIKEIRFDVTGLSGTVGFCNVTIPIDLLGGPYTAQIDDLPITPEETTNGTHSFLYFTYSHNTQTVKIKGATVATPPIALFTPSTTSGYVGDTLTFNASASEDPDGEIVSYKWDFGDGTPIVTETDPIATHMYASAGTYPMTLTVTDNQGLTDIATGTATISAKHDVAVANVTPYPSEVTVGELVSINVTVVNRGTETENFNITVYYDNAIIGTKSVTNLAPGASETLTIDWETTGVDPGTYTIKAMASTVTDEIDITNNEFIDGEVTITVQETPTLGILLYVAAAGLAVTILVAIAFYFLRIRKPKPE